MENQNIWHPEMLAHSFLVKLFALLEEKKIEIKNYWDIDHLCYRASTTEKYSHLKKDFLKYATLMTESIVNGRPISTFKLDKPIHFKQWKIDIIELPAPKPGKTTIDGFEHIEVVVDDSLQYLSNLYHHLPQDKNGMAKLFNPELEIHLDKNVNIKFHNVSLESVVRLELNSKVWSAIQNCRVLEFLKDFHPLIAGTYPLGVSQPTSDVDVLLTSNDFSLILDIVQIRWGHCENFHFKKSKLDDMETLIINFSFQNIPFELFVQNIESVKQKAYRHFLAEEKLLKYKSAEFKEKILRIRSKGVKTEPAFAQALGVDGNPFEELLKIQTMYIEKIKYQ